MESLIPIKGTPYTISHEIRYAFSDRKPPARLGANQRPFYNVHVHKHAVQRLEERGVFQKLGGQSWRQRSFRHADLPTKINMIKEHKNRRRQWRGEYNYSALLFIVEAFTVYETKMAITPTQFTLVRDTTVEGRGHEMSTLYRRSSLALTQ